MYELASQIETRTGSMGNEITENTPNLTTSAFTSSSTAAEKQQLKQFI